MTSQFNIFYFCLFSMGRFWKKIRPFVFQTPAVVLLILRCLFLKRLHPLMLMKADPDLSLGGIGEVSKFKDQNKFNRKYFLDYFLVKYNIPLKEKLKKIGKFSKYPVVVKPDNGRSGKGVFVARNKKELEDYLKSTPLDLIAQKYSTGKEFGVFYYKLNNKGHIFGITSKELPHVIGDGKSTLRDLIKRNWPSVEGKVPKNIDANYVPKKGENAIASYVGNRSHGSIFRDASHLATKPLTKSIKNAIGNADFNYGRLDVVADSEEELKKGNIKVIEANGVHSFATHFYGPRYNLFDAFKIANKQYKILLNVAIENKNKKMYIPSNLREFFKLTAKSESSLARLEK